MLDMNKTRSLITFVGMRDPYPENDEETGPILAFLIASAAVGKALDEVWLLCTGGTFLERAKDLEREARDEGLRAHFHSIDFPLHDVIDYSAIWSQLDRSLAIIAEKAGTLSREWIFLLDSGTPQMKTSLFLAARSGLFPATLIQGIPPRFAGGTYKSREVSVAGFPEIRIPGPTNQSDGKATGDSIARRFDRAPSALGASPREALGEGVDSPIAKSQAFAEALRKALSAARYDDPVLILGETGTGKTMIARRIHAESARKSGPFVEVNCSAIPESLAESELFGHARGAFSGADKARSGKFRAAHAGTLFLDEVGDLALDVQAKLLKALEDKVVTPVGSEENLNADARLIAATNRDLPALIKAGHFRRDLYERLKVVVIALPPLRERREEVRPLVDRFLSAWNERYGEKRYLTEDALVLLESYSWPGNVRELQNALRSAACSAASEALGPESLPDEIRHTTATCLGGLGDIDAVYLPSDGLNLKARLLQIEWQYVAAALRKAKGNREAAAVLLGLSGHAFRKALRERFSAFADEGWEEGM
ncbi:MAG: sigma-54 dependent transcriptional regulator [Spirochaetaceae bacterium]|nr:sigma-54 dependent transcriptional regulator [Spirochaetaceae bacterium]